MGLPWWLSVHSLSDVARVLGTLAHDKRLQLTGGDADIACRLMRNGYVRGELESTVIGVDGPVAIELCSRGLTDLGEALRKRLEPARGT